MQEKPVIELKNINHHACLSQETYAYTATIYVDGKKWADVSSNVTPAAGKTYKDVTDLVTQFLVRRRTRLRRCEGRGILSPRYQAAQPHEPRRRLRRHHGSCGGGPSVITLTVVVTEVASTLPPCYPRPLIYEVEVECQTDHRAILADVARQRADDLDLDIDDPAKREMVAQGLRLEFAFEGAPHVLEDWRD